MIPSEDLAFAEFVVSQGLATREQVDECLSQLKRLQEAGVTPLPKVGELLVRRGYLSTGQVEGTLRVASRKTVARSDAPLPPEAAKAASDPAARWGKYIRVTQLGAGGMGEVWRAWDRELGRWVALKFLKHQDPEELQRFKREAQTAAKLNHPNIASVYEVGEHAGKSFISMQCVDGKMLHDLPRRDLKLLVRHVRDASLAVHYAHEQGVVHRDIKPANIMVEDKSRRVYVMDFGLAKSMNLDSSLSVAGAIVGTPSYMSPEQAQGSAEIDGRTDVYGLGATLYELLSGRPPFRDANVYQLLQKVIGEDPPTPRRFNARIDRDLETIVLKCLEKEPERRYSTALDLAADLGRWVEGDAILAHPPSTLYRIRKFVARRKAVTGAVTLALVFLFAFVAYRWSLRAEGKRWASEAEERAKAGDYEEAKRLFDQARTRVPINQELYARCEAELAERKTRSEEKRREDEAFGPIREQLKLLPDREEGWSRAVTLLDEGLARYAGAWEPWLRKGEFLEKLARYDEALEAYARAVEKNPSLMIAHYRRGRIFMDRKDDFNRARVEFEAARRGSLENEYAVVAQARVAVMQKNYREALDLCDQAEPVAGHTSDLHFVRAFICADKKGGLLDLERAKQSYMRVLEIEPRHTTAWLNLGRVRDDLGELDGALAAYAEALKINPKYDRAFSNRAGTYIVKREFDRAIDDATAAIALNPNLAEAYSNRGFAYQAKGDLERAMKDYERALQINPDFVDGLLNRGTVFESRRDFDRALADYSRAVEVDTRCAKGYFNRGSIRLQKGEFETAVAEFTKAIEVDSRYAKAFCNRGVAFANMGDFKSAVRDYDRALDIDPSLPEAYVSRGLAWIAQKDADRAAADFRKALDVAPAEWRPRSQVEEYLKRLGRSP